MAVRRWLGVVLGVLPRSSSAWSCSRAAVRTWCASRSRSPRPHRSATTTGRPRRSWGASRVFPRWSSRASPVPSCRARRVAARQQRGGAIDNLHILVFSTRENKLVRLTLPMWLLRMSPDGKMDINSADVDLENVRLSIEDLEAAGPGPLFAAQGRRLTRPRLGRVDVKRDHGCPSPRTPALAR